MKLLAAFVALCLSLSLLAPTAFAARVVVSAGSVEIEVIDWAVHAYVVRNNTATGQMERVPNFKFVYEPIYVGEYWDFSLQVGKDFGAAPIGIPINISLPNDNTAYDTAYTIALANGSVSNVLERTVRLSNGANFTQIVETFTKDSWKPLYGWRVPVAPDTLKITARFTNWPLNTSIIPANMTYSKFIDERAVLMAAKTRIEMLFRDEATGFFLKDDTKWPLFSYEDWGNLEEPVDSSVMPDKTIGQSLLTFRDRRFTLDLFLIRNASACDDNDMNCIWQKLANSRVNIGNQGYSDIADASVNVDTPFAYDLPLYIGMSIFDKPNVEWDPNINVLFAADSSAATPTGNRAPTLSGEAVFESPGTNAAVIGGSIAAAVVVVIIAIVVYFKGRTTLKRRSQARVSRAAETARTEEEEQRRRATSSAPDFVPAPSAESKRWTQASRGRALTNVDDE